MMTQTQTGALLHEDHMQTIETLQSVEELIGRARKAPAVEGDLKAELQRLATTMRAEVEQHFGFEENYLFPEFARRGEMGIVTMLTHEHRAILPLALEAAGQAEAALENGFDDDAWEAFCDTASELVERETFHIQKEEMGLLAAISALLDAATDAQLAETYRRVVKKDAA